MTLLLSRAHKFAKAAHSAVDHRRKYTDEPYIAHPEAVAHIVTAVGGSKETVAAAYLHDVVEDTRVTIEEIYETFGQKVGTLVEWLTDVAKPTDGNRVVRTEINRLHSAAAPPNAQTIKLADLIDNTSTITKYDPAFAVTYMREKRLLLQVMDKGNAMLYDTAWQLVLDWERNL